MCVKASSYIHDLMPWMLAGVWRVHARPAGSSSMKLSLWKYNGRS